MRYIVCEDNGSGFYFWSLIKEHILQKHYRMVTADMMNEVLGLDKKSNTIGVGMIAKYLDAVSSTHKDMYKDDVFIVCVDWVVDNPDVTQHLNRLSNIIRNNTNMHVFEYICFEELLLATGGYEKLVPITLNMNNNYNAIYNIMRNNYKTLGLGYGHDLKLSLDANNIKFSNTERIFNKIIESLSISSKQKIGKREYIRMYHHYICKGKWSVCWKTDCTPDCPNDKCWEASNKNNIMCGNCSSPLKGNSQSCILTNDTALRNFAEETSCNKQLPTSFITRLKLVFDIPEIRAIDNY